MTRDEILSELRSSLEEMFEIAPADVVDEAHLRDDLDLDSIDAIDLAVRLKKLLGRRVELAVLKELRTVKDVVDLIEKEVSKGASDSAESDKSAAAEPIAEEPVAAKPGAAEAVAAEPSTTEG